MSDSIILDSKSSKQYPADVRELTADDWDLLDESFEDRDFLALFLHHASDSEPMDRADEVDLCRRLAAVTGNDPVLIDAFFRASGLFTSRWDTPQGETTYGQAAIKQAISENVARVPRRSPDIIEGIIRTGEFCVLCGYYNCGKTPLLQQTAFCIANGLPWLGRKTLRRVVTILDFETPHDVYASNMLRLSQRYTGKRTTPSAHLLLSRENSPGVTVLDNLSGRQWRQRLQFIESILESAPDTLFLIDPAEHFFHFDRRRSRHVLHLFLQLRELLIAFPLASIILVMNHGRRGNRRNAPSLLTDPLLWLEGNAGNLDLLNRCDVRLGFDFHDDTQRRVIHGARRTTEIHPIIVRQVGTAPNFSGFELVQPESNSLELVLTPRRREHWRRLPERFRFDEIVSSGLVPKSSLSRLIRNARSIGLLDSQGGWHQKL